MANLRFLSLGAMPRHVKAGIIAALVIITIVASFYYFLYSPMAEDIKRIKVETSEVEMKIMHANELRDGGIQALKDDLARIDAKRSELFSRVPSEMDVSRLVSVISSLAEIYKISDIFFTTDSAAINSYLSSERGGAPPRSAEKTATEGIDHFMLKASFNSKYAELSYFLNNLGNLDRLIDVEHVKIRRGLPLLSVDLLIRAYYLKKGESV